jgi:glycosyltransferase involved in cell wall biosynthesis
MRIGILGIKHIPGVMGADRTVESMLRRLPKEHEYMVYVVRDGGAGPAAQDNIRYVQIPAVRGKHLHAGSYFALSSLHAALIGGYDVIHVHNSDFGAFCVPLRLRRSARIVGTFHGDPYVRAKWGPVAKRFLRMSEWCFVRCAHVLTSVTAVKRVRGRDVEYIPNGIDRWHGHGDRDKSAVQRFDVEPGQFLVFACGRLDRTKGLHHLIEAYRAVPGEKKLVVIGDFSHDREYARSIETAAERDPRILLHRELVRRDDLLEMVSQSAAFVFPSEVEGMSMMLLEAISCGATVVCADIPENTEVVGADYPLLFRSKDSRSLAEVLARAFDWPAESYAKRTVREKILREFRWDVVAQQYADIYESFSSAGGNTAFAARC